MRHFDFLLLVNLTKVYRLESVCITLQVEKYVEAEVCEIQIWTSHLKCMISDLGKQSVLHVVCQVIPCAAGEPITFLF